MTIEDELAQANARITSLEGDLAAANDLLGETQGHVTTLTTRAETAEAGVTRLTGELTTANTSLTAVTGDRDAISAAITSGGQFVLAADRKSISLTPEGKVQFVNDEATRVVAASGHGQLPLAVDNNALGNATATAGKPGAGRTKTTWNK